MLTDPRCALAEQNDVVHVMVGLAGVARMVRALAADPTPGHAPRDADDPIHLLLGLVSIGDAVERLGDAPPSDEPAPPVPDLGGRWLR